MPKADGTIEITPLNWDEVATRLKDHAIMQAAINSGLKKIGKEILVPATKNESPRGVTGNLKKKTVGQVLGKDTDMRLEIRQSAFSGSYPYGAGVRTGTRPHWTSWRNLLDWVTAKWRPSNPIGAAIALQRSIARKGTAANPYHERVLEANAGQIQQIMEEQIKRAEESGGK